MNKFKNNRVYRNCLMNSKTQLFALVICLFTVALTGCSNDLSYEDWLERETASGVQNDTLFLGYYFGMERQNFRDASWEMNQQGLMSGFTKINYPFNELNHRATMEFWPDFTDDKVSRIPIEVSYNAWAPWNRDFWSENLMEDLVEYYESKFETRFRHIYVPEIEANAFVSIEGNREIRISRINDQKVMLDFIDHSRIKSSGRPGQSPDAG